MDTTENIEECVEQKPDGLYVQVRLIAKASREEVVGVHNGQLKVTVHAAPVDGEANEAMIEVLGDFFNVAKSRIEIVHGLRSPDKTICILGRDE